MRKWFFLFLLVVPKPSISQTFNSQIVVNADLVDQTNRQIFETLERALTEFVNTQSWTDREFLPQERIRCSFVLTLTSYKNNQFEGTLQVQSLRPIFNTDYESPLLNFLDKDIVFSYQEFQPLFFNEALYQSNLISLFSFYSYIILGMDTDSFEPNGGSVYFEKAQQIVNLAQQSKISGWNQNDGNRNRFWLIDSLRSNTFKEFREAQYVYHRNGLDQMTQDGSEGKQKITEAITLLEKLYQRRPNAFLLQLFFDAKSQELVDVLSGGPKIELAATRKTLETIAPFFGPKWRQIKN
ncbi:MAG: DUF4835 family protein [Flavobacteriaceae bacterium]|jgi:hypothetical protein